MSLALRVLFGLALILCASLAHAQDQRFTHAGVQADAKRYEAYLRANWQPGYKTGARVARRGEKALAASTDPRAASRAYAQAVVADANDADAWLGLARSLLAIKRRSGLGALRSSGQCLGRGADCLRARANARLQGVRALGAA